MAVTAVIGRDVELAAMQSFLDGVPDGPSALVLSGEPGIGKTILWETGVDEASGQVGQVLTCRGVEAEASLSFAGLSELLAPVLAETLPVLVPPRRRALEIALLLAEPGDQPPDAHAIGLAVLDVVRALVERGSVLVALDDVQWLDAASSGVLQIAFRRLGVEPVGLLATLRVGTEIASPLELEQAFPGSQLLQLAIGPLSLGAVHSLLEERLGLQLSRPELVRVQEATAGNPFFALELGRELVRTGSRPAPGRALRVPDSLQELLGGRLARLPGETLDVLLEVAALARPTVEVVAEVQGDRDRVLEVLEAGVKEGVVELDDSNIRFAHPLLASICYERAPVWKRRAVHLALAEAVTDSEERARHLALATDGPDSGVASELDGAAEHAAARGSPAAAAELCELAAELTPEDPIRARQRRLQAARYHSLAGDPDRAVDLLDRLLEDVPSGTERADVLLARIFTVRGETPGLVAMCDEALEAAAGDDLRCARILALRSWAVLIGADVRASLADARAALELAERTGDPALIVAVIARLAQAESWSAEITPGLVERGADLELRLELSLDWRESSRLYLPRLLMRQGEIERPRALLEELRAQAAARGHETTQMITLWYLGLVEWTAGRWQLALDYCSAAFDLSRGEGEVHKGWWGRVKALVETDLGLVEQARISAEEGLASARSLSNEIWIPIILGVLGRLELALGNLQEAGEYLRDLPGACRSSGVNDPTLTLWADAIETLVALGEVEQARDYLGSYEENARRLGSPWSLAAAARCRGLLDAADGDVKGAYTAFEQAFGELEEHPYPLERGRTLLCLGTVRRQAQEKRAARQALEQALATFEELGAPLWAEKAHAELRRISGRRPADEELTETERRVAELAAQGRTNKEIAAELFMGVSTVEAHLSRVYRKLGIRSRGGLGTALAKARDEAAQA